MFDAVFHKLLHKFESILNHQTQISFKTRFFFNLFLKLCILCQLSSRYCF